MESSLAPLPGFKCQWRNPVTGKRCGSYKYSFETKARLQNHMLRRHSPDHSQSLPCDPGQTHHHLQLQNSLLENGIALQRSVENILRKFGEGRRTENGPTMRDASFPGTTTPSGTQFVEHWLSAPPTTSTSSSRSSSHDTPYDEAGGEASGESCGLAATSSAVCPYPTIGSLSGPASTSGEFNTASYKDFEVLESCGALVGLHLY